MTAYVFDTEALIAYLYDEPGCDAVKGYLTNVETGSADGFFAETNAAELLYLVARLEGRDGRPTADSLRAADRDLRALNRWGLTLDRADWRLAGEIKAAGHISLADAHAVALAHDRTATLLVGADDDFDDLPIDIDVVRFRNDAV